MKSAINAKSKLEAKFWIYSHYNKILVYKLDKDGLETKKQVLANYSYDQYIDPNKDFADSKFEHQVLRLATQILLYEILWDKVSSYMPYRGLYSEKDLRKLVKFFQRGENL